LYNSTRSSEHDVITDVMLKLYMYFYNYTLTNRIAYYVLGRCIKRKNMGENKCNRQPLFIYRMCWDRRLSVPRQTFWWMYCNRYHSYRPSHFAWHTHACAYLCL